MRLFTKMKYLIDHTVLNPRVDGVAPWQFKHSLQKNDYTCGSRSGFMVARFFGIPVCHKDVKIGARVDRDGTDEGYLCDALRSFGLKPRIVANHDFDALRKALADGRMAIVNVDTWDHYMVVHGITDKMVFVADPATPAPWARFMTHDEFLERWDEWSILVGGP